MGEIVLNGFDQRIVGFFKHIKMNRFVLVKPGICGDNGGTMEYFPAGQHLPAAPSHLTSTLQRQELSPFYR